MITDPFPHEVLQDAWGTALLKKCYKEFDLIPDDVWQKFRNDLELKDAVTFDVAQTYGATSCASMLKKLSSATFMKKLETITGIEGLQYDGYGGGLHRIPVGGFLAVHRDFNVDTRGRWRRVNVLVYLNEDWDDDDNGHLELHGSDVVSIAPELNTTVVFICGQASWHGHPIPVKRERRSLAAYYFTSEPAEGEEPPHSTIFL